MPQEDVIWALDLEAKFKTGNLLTADETARYEQIAKRLSNP